MLNLVAETSLCINLLRYFATRRKRRGERGNPFQRPLSS
jgi:hypothetical protein